MPLVYGGSPYKKVQGALTTAAIGLNAAFQGFDGEENEANSPCDVQALETWYWGEDGSFVPEIMYYNAREITANEHRLIVTLSSFQSLTQAYVMAVEKENAKATLLHEKEELFKRCRVGYYKELQHLRELLAAARRAILMGRSPLDDATAKRMQELEKYVQETEVYYFNIVDYLEPELKGIMSDACKQFNRDLMKEIFDLRDRLSLYESSGAADDALIERLMLMLMGKGVAPAKIVKVLAGVVSGKEQSDEFHGTMRELLGIGARPPEEKVPRRSQFVRQQTDKQLEPTQTNVSRSRYATEEPRDPEPEHVKPVEEDTHQHQDMARLLAVAKAENEKLKNELEAWRKKYRQLEEDSNFQIAKLRAELDLAKKEAADARAEQARLQAELKSVMAAKTDGPVVAPPPLRVESAAPRTPEREPEVKTVYVKEVQEIDPLEWISRDEYDRLMKMLREAQAELHKAQVELAQLQGKPPPPPPEPIPDTPVPVVTSLKRPSVQIQPPTIRRNTTEEPKINFEAPPKKTIFSQGLNLLDRNFEGPRADLYSYMSGKPINVLEAELSAERRRRLDVENDKRRLIVEVDVLTQTRTALSAQLAEKAEALSQANFRLDTLVNNGSKGGTINLGLEQVGAFCRFLIRRYGSLELGYRSMEGSNNGAKGLVFHDFFTGLNTIGWSKAIGRQVFDEIDAMKQGHITLDMLLDLYSKYLEGHPEDLTQSVKSDLKDQEKSEKDERRLEMAMERLKRVEVEKASLEEEISALKRKIIRNEGNERAQNPDSEKLKQVERKAENFQTGYERLTKERDAISMKLAIALTRCREANILQVKYKREAEVRADQFVKLSKKFQMFRAYYVASRKQDQRFARSPKQARRDPQDPPNRFTISLVRGPHCEATQDDSSAAEDTDDRVPTPIKADSTPPSIQDPLRSTGFIGAELLCPRCNAVLRMDIAECDEEILMQAMIREEEEGGAYAPPVDLRESAEELIGKLTDEELLNGINQNLEPSEPLTMTLGGYGSTGAGGRLLPYRTRAEARLKQAPMSRTDILYLDAVDRNMYERTQPSFADVHTAPTSVLSQESQQLIEHARQIRLLWREAVPIDEALPLQRSTYSDDSRDSRNYNHSVYSKQQLGNLVPVTVGRSPQKTATPFGNMEEFAKNIQLNMNYRPAIGQVAHEDNARQQERKKLILEDYNRKMRYSPEPPERDASLPAPPLCIVGGQPGGGGVAIGGGVQPIPPTLGAFYTGGDDGRQASRTPPSLGAHDNVEYLHYLEATLDEGVNSHAASNLKVHGRTSVVGMWNSHHPGAKRLHEEKKIGLEIGTGLQLAPEPRGKLPQKHSPSVGRKISHTLPQLPQSPGAAGGSAQGRASKGISSSTSMPVLERPLNIPTPPLAVSSSAGRLQLADAALGSKQKVRRPSHQVTEEANAKYSLGRPPPGDDSLDNSLLCAVGVGQPGAGCRGLPPPSQFQFRGVGAGHAIPNRASSKRIFELATGVFELGAHVHRHMAQQMAPSLVCSAQRVDKEPLLA